MSSSNSSSSSAAPTTATKQEKKRGRKPAVYTAEELQERMDARRQYQAEKQKARSRHLVAEVARLHDIEKKYEILVKFVSEANLVVPK